MRRNGINAGKTAQQGISECLRREIVAKSQAAPQGEPLADGEVKHSAQWLDGYAGVAATIVRRKQKTLFAVRKQKTTPQPIPPGAVAEHRFHPKRKWRFDHAYVPQKIAVEIEGGAFINGRHVRGAGFIGDMRKYREAELLGWMVLRVTPQEFRNGTAAELVRRAFEFREMPLVQDLEFGP